jgi:acetyltransferase-like isoleucine patch superfamily enzyme
MKRFIKPLLNAIAAVIVSPAVCVFRLQAAVVGADRVFNGWSQLFSLIPGLTGVSLRHAFLRLTTKGCGEDVCVSFGTLFSHRGVSLGKTVYIGHYCSIGDITIEDDVLIASHVSIMNGCWQHGTERLDIPMREQNGVYEPVTIGCDSWIGERAIVTASIGRHCIIGAGALVLSPVPDYCIAVGVPARVIRDRRQPHPTNDIEASLDRADCMMKSLLSTALER